MKVKNREGQSLDVSYDEIKRRILRLCSERELQDVDIDHVIIQTINGIYDGITTYELDDLSARICATMQAVHHTYDVIASKIVTSNMAKSVRRILASAGYPLCFSGKVAYLASKLPRTYDPNFTSFVKDHASELDAMISYERDANHSYFALRTLERSYLMRIGDVAIESPQDMFMRVAVALHMPAVSSPPDQEEDDQSEVMRRIHQCYYHMSRGDYTHATPTLFNAGMKVQQCSSCFVENTPVLTKTGAKKIEEVAIGDVVLTHTGRYRPVTQIHRNFRGDRVIHRLQVKYHDAVMVTDNHKFWTWRAGEDGPRWIRADELDKDTDTIGTVKWSNIPASSPVDGVETSNSSLRFCRIDVLEAVPDVAPEFVYTLGVEDDHSYPVGGGILAENCYLLGTEDSLSGIFKTLADCAQISKWAGGIGVHVSNVRSKGSKIQSTNGRSDGIIPMLKVYNETARYCNQSGRRKGSIAVYLEPWHADVWEFVELRRNTGAETERARDLFLALWVPDEFMRRVVSDEEWFLMTPDECPGLVDAIGEDFTTLYNKYVDDGKYVHRIKARELWTHILTSQIETGTPYMAFKDHVNRKNNTINVSVTRSSNLCCEITLPSDSEYYAVCNLASIAVNRYFIPAITAASSASSSRGAARSRAAIAASADPTNVRTIRASPGEAYGTIDHARLHEIAKEITINLNRVIDVNSYPTPEARRSNMALRPLGIGVQGFGDLYCMLKLPYDDPESMRLDAEIMETIYHGAMEASVELAKQYGPYSRFAGSPASEGKLQIDLWGLDAASLSGRYDWDAMRALVKEHGLRNSLLVALMPTASTSQILGNCESFEPFQSNVFKRSTLAGEFLVVNRHLQKDLMNVGLWDDDMRKRLLADDGSVQRNPRVPDDIKRVYRTVWEVSQKSVVDHAVARGPFVCQSQSMNLYMTQPTVERLTSALVYGWRRGLKTGMYYLRSTAAVEAIKYGLSASYTSGSSNTTTATTATTTATATAANPNTTVTGAAAAATENEAPGQQVPAAAAAPLPLPPRGSKCDPNSDVCLMCSS